MKSSPDTSSILNAGFAFFVGTLLLLFADVFQVLTATRSWEEQVAVLKWMPTFFILGPSLAGLLAFTGALLHRRLRAIRYSRAGAVTADTVISIPLLIQIPPLFEGPAIASSPLHFPLLIMAMLLCVAGVTSLRILTELLMKRIQEATPRQRVLIGLGTLFCSAVAAVLLRKLSFQVLPFLYWPYHRALALIAIAFVSAALMVIFVCRTEVPRRPGLVPILFFCMSSLGLILHVSWANTTASARSRFLNGTVFVQPFIPSLTLIERITDFSNGPAVIAQGVGEDYSRVVFGNVRRSVVLITVDALRADSVLPVSGATSMPALKALCEKFLCYTKAYAPSNYTPFSIPALLSGRHMDLSGDLSGLSRMPVSAFHRGDYETHFFFTAHSYANFQKTAIWPLVEQGFRFMYYYPEYESAERVLKNVQQLIAAGGQTLIWAHLSDVHAPFLSWGKDGSSNKAFPRTYKGQTAYLDGELDLFMQWLQTNHPDVVWAISSDHGESFGEHGTFYHGTTFYDEQVKVPLIMGGPGVPSGRYDNPVANMGVLTTLLSLAGGKLPTGFKILPLSDSTTFSPALLVSKSGCAVVDDNWKLIVDVKTGVIELFDLERDTGELSSRLDSQMPLAIRMADWMRRSGCPYPLPSALRASQQVRSP